MQHREVCCLSAGAAVLACAAAAFAAPRGTNLHFTQAHGHTFSEIGAVGNAAYQVRRVPGGPVVREIGAVNYRYRIATQEVQGRHWIEFVNAYAPYVGDDFLIANFTGITTFAGFNNGVPYYTLDEGNENVATVAGMRYMTRYANWLHHGAPTGPDVPQSVFESGAYDTSTFGNTPGQFTDQEHRSPGARFFLPTVDEWTKAVYYDPDRNGEGEGGYWLYPNQGDDPLVTGHPDNGGETNADSHDIPGIPREAGSYPNETSPWGLLDASGGQHEIVEDYFFFPGSTSPSGRTDLGSSILSTTTPDHIGERSVAGVSASNGFRIAMAIPSPGASAAVLLGGITLARRRR